MEGGGGWRVEGGWRERVHLDVEQRKDEALRGTAAKRRLEHLANIVAEIGLVDLLEVLPDGLAALDTCVAQQ